MGKKKKKICPVYLFLPPKVVPKGAKTSSFAKNPKPSFRQLYSPPHHSHTLVWNTVSQSIGFKFKQIFGECFVCAVTFLSRQEQNHVNISVQCPRSWKVRHTYCERKILKWSNLIQHANNKFNFRMVFLLYYLEGSWHESQILLNLLTFKRSSFAQK